MADDTSVDDGHEGEFGDPTIARTEFVEQTRFRRLFAVVSVERIDDDESDVVDVTR